MPIANQLWKLSWGGPLFGTEQWNCSLYFNGPIVAGPASNFETALSTFHGSGTANMAAAAVLTYIKFNQIDPVTGKYLSAGISDTHFLAIPKPGTGTNAPGQNCLAISTTTAMARGYAHIGRFYAPTGGSALTVDATGRMTTTLANAYATTSKALLLACNTVTGAEAVVYSKTGQVVHAITGVRVGRVLDTQRRRRTSLIEDPQAQSL